MPQFNFNIFSEQITWLFFIFGILYIMMYKIALPKVSNILENREKNIQDNLIKARILKKETDLTIEKYEQIILEAHKFSEIRIREAMQNIATDQYMKTEEFMKNLMKDISQSEKDISISKENTIKKLSIFAPHIACQATEKLIGIKIQQTIAQKAVLDVIGN